MSSHSDLAVEAAVGTGDPLDLSANRIFPGKVVRKDLVRKVKVGANVPVFVLEYLLGKYCASEDPFRHRDGAHCCRDDPARELRAT